MERFFLPVGTAHGQRGYVAGDNLKAMRLMRQITENRPLASSSVVYGS